jgi:hypothetical protein
MLLASRRLYREAAITPDKASDLSIEGNTKLRRALAQLLEA